MTMRTGTPSRRPSQKSNCAVPRISPVNDEAFRTCTVGKRLPATLRKALPTTPLCPPSCAVDVRQMKPARPSGWLLRQERYVCTCVGRLGAAEEGVPLVLALERPSSGSDAEGP